MRATTATKTKAAAATCQNPTLPCRVREKGLTKLSSRQVHGTIPTTSLWKVDRPVAAVGLETSLAALGARIRLSGGMTDLRKMIDTTRTIGHAPRGMTIGRVRQGKIIDLAPRGMSVHEVAKGTIDVATGIDMTTTVAGGRRAVEAEAGRQGGSARGPIPGRGVDHTAARVDGKVRGAGPGPVAATRGREVEVGAEGGHLEAADPRAPRLVDVDGATPDPEAAVQADVNAARSTATTNVTGQPLADRKVAAPEEGVGRKKVRRDRTNLLGEVERRTTMIALYQTCSPQLMTMISTMRCNRVFCWR